MGQEILQFLQTVLERASFTQIVVTGVTTTLVVLLLFNRDFREGLFNSLFLSDRRPSPLSALRRRVLELDLELKTLKSEMHGDKTEGYKSSIQKSISAYLNDNLQNDITQKIEELKLVDSSVTETLKESADTAVLDYLKSVEPGDILLNATNHKRERERSRRSDMLERTISAQMASADSLKKVMINLFILFNLGILFMYVFSSFQMTMQISDKVAATILGLYVSLAAFIVYIYRTTNSRTSVLLALTEDNKKLYDAKDYLMRLKPYSSPSERDVEIVKLLLLNRSEREKITEHPYEVILKGVTNSNVLFRGGKVASSKKNDPV